MDDGFTPAQLTTLCIIFVGFHLLALPAFFWAMRHRQFTGREQRVWTLDDSAEALPSDSPSYPRDPCRVRWMLGILVFFGALMLSAIFLTVLMALTVPTHPGAAGAKCPFL